MFSRTISCLAILAVIACPLWCSAGLCQGGDCCATTLSTPAESCCDRCGSEQEEQAPVPSPQKSSCQGVCGGAIFEKPCQINGLETVVLRPLPAAIDDVSVDTGAAPRHSEIDKPPRNGPDNVGRTLRALQMSFLC